MVINSCTHCGQKFSSNAACCPGCGRQAVVAEDSASENEHCLATQVQEKQTGRRVLAGVVFIVLGLGFLTSTAVEFGVFLLIVGLLCFFK